MGFFMMPLLPTALETAVEVSYPIPDEMSASFLMLLGNIMGLVFTYTMQFLIALQPSYTPGNHGFTPVTIFLLSAVAVSTVFILSFNGQYKRLEMEKLRLQTGLQQPLRRGSSTIHEQ